MSRMQKNGQALKARCDQILVKKPTYEKRTLFTLVVVKNHFPFHLNFVKFNAG